MSRIIIFLVVVMVSLSGTAYAVNNQYNSLPWQVDTLLSAVTTTGTTGTAVSLIIPVSKFTCAVTWGGTAPTNTVIKVDGSIDGTSYEVISTASVTVTATPTIFHIVDKPVLYIRGGYTSRAGGDGTTSVTLKCLSGSN